MSSIIYQGSTEEQIREGCANGDRKFQQLLYNMLSAKMFAVCLRYANEYNSAQDLLQEGFVKVYKNIEKFRGEGSMAVFTNILRTQPSNEPSPRKRLRLLNSFTNPSCKMSSASI